MTLDVVVPTFNRSKLLRKALLSLFAAALPEGLSVQVIVVDNQSTDDTVATVRELRKRSPFPLLCITAIEQRSSAARNAGIAAGNSEIIGFIDDDEEVAPEWLEVIAREFRDESVQFIGGPCLPNWQAPAPEWLPPGYHSAIGAIPPKPRGRYGEEHPGILNGGNAVVRRSVFEQVGLYSTRLGRTPKGLLSEEDAEFYRRLLDAGLGGMYVPELIIHHYIPASRLTRKYHRSWAYWRAVSQGVLDREVQEPVVYLFGIPRHRIGRALRGALLLPLHSFAKNQKGQAFADELATWDLAGFIHGKFFTTL